MIKRAVRTTFTYTDTSSVILLLSKKNQIFSVNEYCGGLVSGPLYESKAGKAC